MECSPGGRVFDRKLSQSSGAGRRTKDAEDGDDGRRAGRRRAGADAPGVQGQQPDVPKTAKDKNAPSARSKTAKDKTRDKNVARALGPDVVNDKGQRIPFSRRGWESPDSDDNDGDKTMTDKSTGIQAGQARASHAAHDM